MNAFQRMIDRRGMPSYVISDNGTNVVGAMGELKELVDKMDKKDIAARMVLHKIKWHFNPPAGPYFGGVHAALVKSAKRAIYSILNYADVTDEKLATAFIGAEALINSRLLTYQSRDIRDDLPLTLNHFLYGHQGHSFEPGVDETRYTHRQRWCRMQELAEHIWKR